jgi:hypothetical protein
MNGARGPLNMAVNWPGPPFVVRQAVGVAHAKSGDEYLRIQTYELLLFAGESIPEKKKGILVSDREPIADL